VSKKSQYLQHLDNEIAKHQKALDEAVAARTHYLRFSPKNGQNQKTSKTGDDVGRKGLRAKGRSRDLFEYFYNELDGADFSTAARITGYTIKDIQQFYHRYREQELLDHRGDRIYITAKGIALVDASQPYAGPMKGQKTS